MSHKSPISLLGALALFSLLPLTACSLDGILPDLDGSAGSSTKHVQAVLHPPKMRSIPPELEGVELEIKDVLMRRSSDQSWNILNDKTALWILGDHATPLPTFSAIPMPVDSYDAIRVVLGDAFVIQGGQKTPLSLEQTELTREGSWKLSGDRSIDLWISLDNTLVQRGSGWQASPKLEIDTRKSDFSSETLPATDKEADQDSGTKGQSNKDKGESTTTQE